MKNLKNTSRREFISKTGMAAAGVAIGAPSLSAASYQRVKGANDKIRMGFIGIFVFKHHFLYFCNLFRCTDVVGFTIVFYLFDLGSSLIDLLSAVNH